MGGDEAGDSPEFPVENGLAQGDKRRIAARGEPHGYVDCARGHGAAHALPVVERVAQGFVEQQVNAGAGGGFYERGFLVVDQAFED